MTPEETIEKLQRRVRELESHLGALMVDKDRSVRAALDRAQDCTKHGDDIAAYARDAERFWGEMTRADEARHTMVLALIRTRDRLPAEGDIPVAKVREFLDRAITEQAKTLRKPLPKR